MASANALGNRGYLFLHDKEIITPDPSLAVPEPRAFEILVEHENITLENTFTSQPVEARIDKTFRNALSFEPFIDCKVMQVPPAPVMTAQDRTRERIVHHFRDAAHGRIPAQEHDQIRFRIRFIEIDPL